MGQVVATAERVVTAPVDRVRLDVFPDGGMARLRLWGRPTAAGREALGRRWFDALPDVQALEVLGAAGVAPQEAGRLVGHRPLGEDGVHGPLADAERGALGHLDPHRVARLHGGDPRGQPHEHGGEQGAGPGDPGEDGGSHRAASRTASGKRTAGRARRPASTSARSVASACPTRSTPTT